MTVGMGTWAVVREPNAFTCTVLKGAAEFRIGTLEITLDKDTLARWIDQAQDAYAEICAQPDDGTAPMVDSLT